MDFCLLVEVPFQEFPLQEIFVSGVYGRGFIFTVETVFDTDSSGGLWISCFVNMQSSLVSLSYTEHPEEVKTRWI